MDPLERIESLGALETAKTQLVGDLLPGEGDFLAILIDALEGDDVIVVGPTVQKTVWIDAGPGDDRVEILSGNAILSDQAEYPTRNDTADDAFAFEGPAVLAATMAVASFVLDSNATFQLSVNGGQLTTVTLQSFRTGDNTC